MGKDKIWLSSPHMGGEEKKYVDKAFEENWIAPLGPNVEAFEGELENFLQGQSQVAVLSSGTAAIHLALLRLGVTGGDEVLCQSFTFAASANPITYLGAKPVFIDSEEKTWNLCPLTLEKAIKDRINAGKKPKAILTVHLYGMPYQVDKIHQLAREYEIPVVEDAAEALGSSYARRKCGTFGDYAVLSFNGNKIITTGGGGALVCRSQEQKKEAIFYATQARDQAPHYQHSKIGYNYRLSNVSAGIGVGQMQVLAQHVALRRKMHAFYQELFKEIDGVTVFSEPNEKYYSNHWLSAILIDPKKTNGISREDLRLAFEKENIESRPLWKPMHLQPVYKDALYYGEAVAENLFAKGLCLPSGSNLTNTDRSRIEKVVKSVFK
ncbi:DegT/DnrJ/EryC1/StrS family aminotransferase [Haloflavibacter putidus]|uniref:Aminotransferase class I/II-fold pyridoxal phosphate-dependent enzyme n=1 Tax=Haloflavibacter putidus TaxID=2576776 RepID=A0A507ZE88_9FLAO|nr:aminotransferase class I/II-fold pyridoxal phosphate-dependent enzyme [Haloflavibacter putidus]TQD34793.1 aminotransferase class I/II-fold pyridoxal phosphate-dependent enzyme [Haloflavibacter putidus]